MSAEPVSLTDDRIDFIAETIVKGMPDGIRGFCNSWGWRQFARAVLADCAGHYAQSALNAAVAAARAEERERCAKLCDEAARCYHERGMDMAYAASEWIAAAIRDLKSE